MINAKLYSRNNCAQRKSANDLLNDFAHNFNWPIDRVGRLLDIGTGSGDVLKDFIIPKIPENARAFGSDISFEMVDFARKTFESESVTFYQADISATYENLRKKIPGTFDNITSFFCFHWIQNQRQAMANIFKLLKPQGTVLMGFLAFSPVYDIYEKLSKFRLYEKYMQDVEMFISPYHHLNDPLSQFKHHLDMAGFQTKHIEIREEIYIYNDVQHLRNAVLSTNPFTKRMPDSLQNQFLDDYIEQVGQLTENKFISSSSEIVYRYKLLVAVLTK